MQMYANFKNFNSSATGRKYKIKDSIYCSTNSVIYQLQCKQDYIDQTVTTLRLKINYQRILVLHQNYNLPVSVTKTLVYSHMTYTASGRSTRVKIREVYSICDFYKIIIYSTKL